MLARTISQAAAVAGFILSGTVAWAAGWEPAAQDKKNAAQSCADMPGDDYVCTFVRCDAKGSLNFYAAAPGPDIEGDVVLDIDGKQFPVTLRKPGSPHLDHTSKADQLPSGFFAALKTGKVLKLRNSGLKSGYDTIPLRNADREIGRIEKMCGIESAATPPAPAVAQAPTAPPADTDALRQGVAQGAAFCKAHLASAPADLKLGEVEEFCTCMGVNEYAMSGMTDEAKASLRPRQQQMCVEIVRKQVQAPAPAAAPAAPPSPAPAPPVTAEQPAANTSAPVAASQPVARQAGMLPFEGEWRQVTNDTCEGSQTITRKTIVERPSGSVDTFKVLAVKQLSETAFNLTVRVHDVAGHGTPTRNRVLRLDMKGENAMSGTGPYLSGQTVEFLRCPDRAPSRAATAQSVPAAKVAPRCNISEAQIEAQFTRESTALRERVKVEFMGTGALSNRTACANMRRMNAFHQEVIKRVSACEAMPNRNKIIAAHRGYIAKNNNSIRSNNWCG